MEKIRSNTFYSIEEKLLFCVAGYTDNSSDVKSIVEMLTRFAKIVADMAPSINVDDVKTLLVTHSRRYKNMRVFYVETNDIPEFAFQISLNNGWTMMKWLENQVWWKSQKIHTGCGRIILPIPVFYPPFNTIPVRTSMTVWLQ